ncbi:MAG: PAC2 family protein [Candidatus Hadarchaeales archaeon]
MPHLNYLWRPKFRGRPLLIAGFPGIASVGKITLEQLIRSLKAELFLELYSEYLPEWAVKREDGVLGGIGANFYYSCPEGVELILLTSDAQAITPYGQYMLTEQILEIAQEMGVQSVITAAAYVLAARERREKVVGAATTEGATERLRRLGVEILEGGVIVGMNGLLPCLSQLRGMEGICLLGTTRGGLVDVEAAKAVLRVLAKMINVKISLENMDERFSLPPFIQFEFPREESEYIR